MIRRGRSGRRFLKWRLGLFFAAVAVWIAGIVLQIEVATLGAIGLILAGIVLGMLARREESEGP